MSSSLSQFRDHCRRMAKALHKPECPSLAEWRPWVPDLESDHLRWKRNDPKPTCDGCNSAEGRALFGQLADEVDDYLAPQVDLFGEVTAEPSLEDA